MPNFRRYYIPNAIVFITGVTRSRVPYFESEDNIKLFWETMRRVRKFILFIFQPMSSYQTISTG
jgi:hypothetical protein